MKTKFMFLSVLVCCLFSVTSFAQTRIITQNDALAIAQAEFKDKDVDYYIFQPSSQEGLKLKVETEWKIFVDAEPMKGWEHECYVITILKTVSNTNAPMVSKVMMKMPPAPKTGEYVPLLVKNRYGNHFDSKPNIIMDAHTNLKNPDAKRTYALIISGGVDKQINYHRYWNDCSFIYQSLTKKYNIPKENIYPLMSDGNDPAVDMNMSFEGFVSQPLDLDEDGRDEIELAATYANVQNTLQSLQNKINEDDHLFIFVIDHGGTDDNISNSYICLWDGDILYDYELAEMLTPFTEKYVNVNVVLGQCYAGGFIDDLTKVGCVVAAACSGSEQSWACTDYPYDEFVYQWTSAINQRNHLGRWASANVNYDGLVTMDEAFAYAKANDREKEHPQYVSTPVSVGEDLAFNHLAPAVNLFIKDDPEDEGKEPNCTTDKFWLSPSIWVRNQNDSIEIHENPVYTPTHESVSVYVRVHNRGKKDYGKKDYKGKKQYVHAYWALASTGFVPPVWMGNETYEDGEVTGGPMTAVKIDSIGAGESRIVKLTWALPSDLMGASPDNNTEKHHFCLLGKILDTYIEPWYSNEFSYSLWGSNKDAQLNLSVIDKSDLPTTTNVFVRNVRDTIQKYTLELVPRTMDSEKRFSVSKDTIITLDNDIFSKADILMEMSETIYDGWKKGGYQSKNIDFPNPENSKIVKFVSKESKIEGVSLAGRVFDKVGLKFNFKNQSFFPDKYIVDLIQRDEEGNIIGGESFIVEAPTSTGLRPIPINSTSIGDGKYQLEAEVDATETVRWETKDGMIIGNTNTVEVCANNESDKTYYVYALSEDGELTTGSIKLESDSGIERIFINEAKTNLDVYLKGRILTGSSVVISSVSTGETILSDNLSPDNKSISFEISSLRPGIYTLAYTVNGVVIDSIKFSK